LFVFFHEGFDAYGLDRSAKEDEQGVVEASNYCKIHFVCRRICIEIFCSYKLSK